MTPEQVRRLSRMPLPGTQSPAGSLGRHHAGECARLCRDRREFHLRRRADAFRSGGGSEYEGPAGVVQWGLVGGRFCAFLFRQVFAAFLCGNDIQRLSFGSRLCRRLKSAPELIKYSGLTRHDQARALTRGTDRAHSLQSRPGRWFTDFGPFTKACRRWHALESERSGGAARAVRVRV